MRPHPLHAWLVRCLSCICVIDGGLVGSCLYLSAQPFQGELLQAGLLITSMFAHGQEADTM